MTRVEKYLYKRIDILSEEKVTLITKINKIAIEIEEIDSKIEEILNDLDSAYEIFSPKPKKNDFNKKEIDNLNKRKEELTALRDEFVNQCMIVEEDIAEIKDSLDDENEDSDEVDLIEEHRKDKEQLAEMLSQATIQSIDDMIYKCDMCTKIVDVDPVRAKLEIQMISYDLKNVQDTIKTIVFKMNPTEFTEF